MQAMPSLFTKDLDPRHERLLAIVLILLALAAIAGTLWRYLPGWIGPGPLAGIESEAGPGDSSPGETRPGLAEHGLFGSAPDAAGAAGELALPINAPQTDLDLTLRGTLATEDPEAALAIIADAENGERTYAVGAELPGDAVLHAVHRDRAILRRAGELETLPLRDPDRHAAASGDTARGGDARSDGGKAGAGRQSRASDRRRDEADELARAAEQLRDDPSALARQFAAVPVQEDGRLVGVRLRATGDSTLLSRIGLRGSDVVTAVNGVPLNDYGRANEVMNQLRSGSDFQVTVLRNGQEQQLDVSLSD